jgi:hypothetical protein
VLEAAVFENNVKLSYVYLTTVIIWVILLPFSVFTWRDSVPFLVFLSWYSNFTSDLNNWMTARMKERSKS